MCVFPEKHSDFFGGFLSGSSGLHSLHLKKPPKSQLGDSPISGCLSRCLPRLGPFRDHHECSQVEGSRGEWTRGGSSANKPKQTGGGSGGWWNGGAVWALRETGWFQICFNDHPQKLGKMSILTKVFQRGWNHQGNESSSNEGFRGVTISQFRTRPLGW